MKKIFLFVSTAVILSAAACSKKAEINVIDGSTVKDEPAVVSGGKTTIKANAPKSRTLVENDGTYKWTNNDAINIFGDDGTSCGQFITEIEEPSTSADFIGEVPEDVSPKYALYPYDESATCNSEGIIMTKIPTVQDGTITSAISYGSSEDGIDFFFNNASSVIRMDFNASDNICGVSVEFEEAVAGNVSLNCLTGKINGASSKVVSVTRSSAFSGPVYLSIAPTAKKTIILTFNRTTDSKTAWLKATVNSAFEKSTIKSLGTVCGLKFYGEPVDLSKNGSKLETANCYIVPEEGRYKFKATVQGNSSTAIATNKVEYLWSTFNTATAPSNENQIIRNIRLGSDGYAIFESTGTAGNVIVAAKGSDGKILWSWHLWCCSGIGNIIHNISNTVGGEFYKMNGQTMLDRNLGALAKDYSHDSHDFGFFYQWGRKDPFVGCTVRKPASDDVANSNLAAVHGTARALTKSKQSIDYSILNPTTYIGGNYDWVSTGNNGLWAETKTKYDPCPVGYGLPTTNSGPWGYFSKLTSWNTTYCGRIASHPDGYNIWYPACGYLNYSEGKFSSSRPGSVGRYWSYYNDASNTSYKWEEAGSSDPTLSTCYRSTGCSVRCQKK